MTAVELSFLTHANAIASCDEHIDHVEHPVFPPPVCAVLDKIIAPHVVAIF